MRDRELKRLYTELLAQRAPADRTACPAPEELRALAERDGAEAARLSLLDHAMTCASCRREFELLRATVAARPRARRRTRAGLAAAAMIALLVGGSLVWRLGDERTGPPVMRGGDQAVRVVEPEGPVSGEPTALVWRAHPSAVRYAVQVTDEDGRAIVSEETRDTTLTVSDPAEFTAGGEYFWWVEAIRLDGTRVRSEPQRFTVRR